MHWIVYMFWVPCRGQTRRAKGAQPSPGNMRRDEASSPRTPTRTTDNGDDGGPEDGWRGCRDNANQG